MYTTDSEIAFSSVIEDVQVNLFNKFLIQKMILK